jgi:hypothetical protein
LGGYLVAYWAMGIQSRNERFAQQFWPYKGVTNNFSLTKLNKNKDLAKKSPWFSSVARLISSFRQEKINFLFSK